MRVCPKCPSRIDDGSKICRRCGAILEEVDDEVQAGGDAAGSSGRAPVLEEQQASHTRQETQDGVEDLVEAGEDRSPQDQMNARPWTCSKCGEDVPKTFDMCWKCGTSREGLATPDFLAECSDDGENVPVEIVSDDEMPAQPQVRLRCVRCGSDKIIPDVRVVDQGQGSDGVAKVVVFGELDALFFKDRRYGQVKAHVCGNCGHVELRVRNPRELYDHYLDSLE